MRAKGYVPVEECGSEPSEGRRWSTWIGVGGMFALLGSSSRHSPFDEAARPPC
jgi:hypothetical protein